MSNIIHSKPYRNWVRGALGLLYVQEGLYPFTDSVVKAEHTRILQNLATCTSCSVKAIQPAHAASGNACIYDHRNKAKCNCRKKAKRVCTTCSKLYDEIITKHRFNDPLWLTDASTWCIDHWQIAKCFMTTTTQGSNNTAAETDAAGLLSIIINGNFFQSEIQSNIYPPHDIFSQVKDIRNAILHNSTLELSDTEVTGYLHSMITVLEDQKTLLTDPSAQAAVKKLKEMVKDELVVTTKEEARAIQTALDAIKEAKEQSEESIRNVAAEGENLVKKTAEQREENLKKLTAEKQASIHNQTLEAEQDIETALKEFNERKEQSEKRLRELTEKGENLIKKTAEQREENLKKLTEEKQTSLQNQALEAEQDIETALKEYNERKEQSEKRLRELTEKGENLIIKTAVQREQNLKKLTEEKQTSLQNQALGARIYAVEKKQSDLEINQQKLEHEVSLLNSTESKHQARLNYLKQKQDLQQHLVELYRNHYVNTWLSPLMTQYNDVNISDVYVFPDMVVEQKDDKGIKKPEEFASDKKGLAYMKIIKLSEKSAHLKQVPINRYQDIFRSRDGKNRRIYIIGDVGTGKSSFCKMMMQNWCRSVTVKSENRESENLDTEDVVPDNDDNKKDIGAFELLFYVPLQFMSGCGDDIAEMIKTQLKDYSTLIDKIFSDESECCLILADGLDEWTPPQRSIPHLPHITYGLPTSRLVRSATMITTSRPSARGILNMKTSEFDIKVNLLGVNGVKTMIKKYMALLDKSSPVNDLYLKLQTLNLGYLQKAPMLLQQIIWMYYNKYAIDKSITYIYTHIVNISFGWMHEKGEGNLALKKFRNTSIERMSLPKMFEEFSRCQEDRDLIIILGKVAYDIFIGENVSSVVLDRYRLKRLGLTDEDISTVVKVGILHEAKCVDPTYRKSQLSFIHTSYLEFFAAVYISSHYLAQTRSSPSNAIEELILRNTSAAELLRLENVLIMACGLSPFLTKHIFECIYQVASTDKQLVEYRRSFYTKNYEYLVQNIQNICFRCVSESASIDKQLQLRVKLCDCIVHTLSELELCLTNVEPVTVVTIRIDFQQSISHDNMTSLLSFLSQAISIESLTLVDVECEEAECDDQSIDLSHHEQLQSLHINGEQISVSGVTPTNLKSCSINYCRLSHDQCTSLSSFLSQAISLESLNVSNVTCKEAECDGHSIDLSNHEQLQSLQIDNCDQISVFGGTPSTILKACDMWNCQLLHEECTSLSSFLSQAISLECLKLRDVKCKEAECDGHSIDLSHHEQLQSLVIDNCDQIPVFGHTPTTYLKSIKIMNCQLSHEQCTSLLSFLPQASSLESLVLSKVGCKEAECDGHSIDLSNHEQLQSLQIDNCDQIHVSDVTPSTSLQQIQISNCQLSHEQCTSLSSFLSQAVSLKSLDFYHVKCKEAECNGHSIDLSHHKQQQSLVIDSCDQIPVFGLTPTTYLTSCKIWNCQLSHRQCISLSSFLSQAKSLETFKLIHVVCKEAECDGHSIDLSHHKQLKILEIDNCDQIFVFGGTPSTDLKSYQIKSCQLSHEQLTSLSSFLSQAVSLQSLNISDVKCKGVECGGHSIDLSNTRHLLGLQIDNCDQISVSSVTTTTSLIECQIENCTLSHEQCTALLAFLSQAVSLYGISLNDVKCKEAECETHSIDLTHHERLLFLKMHDCNQISVFGGTPFINNIVYCQIRNSQLSHEQCISLSSFLSKAVRLKFILLCTVKCKEAECVGHSIDLSHHESLHSLQLLDCTQISVFDVSSTTDLKQIEIRNCQLSHEQCESLSSFLSQAVRLASILLCTVECKEAECVGHSIDLSHHELLHELHIDNCDQKFVFGVTATTNLKQIEIKNCQLSHEQCESFSSFLSQAVSLKSIHVSDVKCKEADCNGHSIDLTHHELLHELHIDNCDQKFVFGVTATTNLRSYLIGNCQLSHERCTSLSSFLSQAISLECLKLRDVKCKEAECDGHSIDLSNHEQLQRLQIDSYNQICAFGVTSTPTNNLKSYQIGNCQLSHAQCTSLSSFISQAILLKSLKLRDVKCKEAECDGHCIDLSNHEQLQSLVIDNCDQISVFGGTPTTNLNIYQVGNCQLSHAQCTSLSSFLSQAISLKCLKLRDVKCKEAECDGHCIDLSNHEQLQSLVIDNCDQISVFGGTLTTNINRCFILNSQLSHEQYISLSSFLSQSVSLNCLSLINVKCKGAECDGHSIDLSHHEELLILWIINCDKISVSGVTPTSNLLSFQIGNCQISQEQ